MLKVRRDENTLSSHAHMCDYSITNLINILHFSYILQFFFFLHTSHTLLYRVSSKDKGLIIHISATKLRLLELADEIGFTKPTRSGMRNFNIGSLDDFIFDSMLS